MEINVLDYLSQDEIKSICEQEVRTKIQRSLSEREIDTIIGNSAYYKAWGVVDEYLKSEYQDKIVEKIHTIIDELSTFSVIRYSYDDRKPVSYASKLIEQTIEERNNDLVAKFNSIIDSKLNGTDDELYSEFVQKLSDSLWNGFTLKFEK